MRDIMHSFHQEKLLPYSSKDLFSMVLDVASYPKFLPWCQAARIVSKTQNEIIAELVIQFKGFLEKYQSRIVYLEIEQNLYIIEAEAISGPFKYLKNTWKFSKASGAECAVDFFIDFKFKSILLDKVMGVFFYQATKRMIKAFEARAGYLFKKSP